MRSPSLSSSKPAAGGGSGDGCSSGKKAASCSKVGLKRGPWTVEEDEILSSYVKKEGEGRWRTLPKRAGLMRCGKSCRLRWMNYLRPSVKRGSISSDEEDLILRLHRLLGNRWSLIAGRIPGRTDNEIKNYWNTYLSKKLVSQGIDPKTHKPFNPMISTLTTTKNEQCYSYSYREQQQQQQQRPVVLNSSQISVSMGNTILGSDIRLIGDAAKKEQQGFDHSNEGTSNYDEDDGIDFLVPDDAFSSFLNSLINDDMFFNNNNNNKPQDQEKEDQQH